MTSSNLTIALAQTDIILGDKAANMAVGRQMAAQAAAQDAELLVFPELWNTGYALSQVSMLAESLWHGPTSAELLSWANEFDMWIVGTMLERTAAGTFNSAALFGPAGQIVGPYRKIHRFGPMAEDRWLEAGCTPGIFDLPWGKTGVAICYDLRFPELFRSYAVAGARLILLPSEWPHPRLHHWRTLVQARAIENQCFVAAVNRVGHDQHNTFCGHSLLVGPWGEIIAEADETATLLVATIDLTKTEEARTRIPSLKDRRPECYNL